MVSWSGKQHPYFATVTDMKFVSVVALLAAPLAASATSISWDSRFDQRGELTTEAVCGPGPDGLLANDYKTFADLPTFPYIGGTPEITRWDSLRCSAPRFT